MSQVYEIADQYVLAYAALDPIAATDAGIAGHEHELTDFSPDAAEARAQLDRDTLAALASAPRDSDRDRIAADVMTERLQLAGALHDAGEELRSLRIIGSPVQDIRACFDLMAYDSEHDWEIVAQRLARVPEAIATLEVSLREGMARGLLAARRQALGCGRRPRPGAARPRARRSSWRWSRSTTATRHCTPSSNATRPRRPMPTPGSHVSCATSTRRSPIRTIRWVVSVTRCSPAFSGIELDLDETYAWGWEELYRIEERMREVAARIVPGEPVLAVAEHLDHDASRTIEGVDEFRQWNQELIDRTIAELNGTHFDIAEPLRRCEAMIAPPAARRRCTTRDRAKTSAGPVAPGTRRRAARRSRCGAR